MTELSRVGKIEGLVLPQLLVQSYNNRISAIIDFQQGELNKRLHLEEGNIIFARSNQKSDRLGEFLLKNDYISSEDLKKAASVLVKTGNRLGRILVEMKLMNPRDLFVFVRHQIAEIALSLFDWDKGQYTVHQDLKPPEERIVLEMSTPELVLNGARRHISDGCDWHCLVPDNAIVSILEDDFFTQLPYTEDEKQVIALLDKPHTMSEFLSALPRDKARIITAFCRLFYLGYVVTKEKKSARSSPIITDSFHWPNDLEDTFSTFNKAYRFIFRYIRIEADQSINERLIEAFESIKTEVDPYFNGIVFLPDHDGTLDLDTLKRNAMDISVDQRLARFFSALNEYLYTLTLTAQTHLSPALYHQLMVELKSILA
ncbi:DUF4388 domain-containing protein [bacterium]|nr:DUF4388 domain-containing protein [bacterium]